MLRDLLRGEDAAIAATVDVLAAAAADIVVLQDIDFDAGAAALGALAELLSEAGEDYPHHLTLRPNTGWPTGLDLDGDGRAHRPRDSHGYGLFNGQGGMAVISRHPLRLVADHSGFLWRDLPDGQAATVTPDDALDVLRLHAVAAWDIAVATPAGPFRLLTSHASAPVFDGPEDRNGRRNQDELMFWVHLLNGWSPEPRGGDGAAPVPPLTDPVIVIGTFNVDPTRGEGRPAGIGALLTHERLQDPRPARPGGGLETADWDDPVPGDLRVDYILPDRALVVTGAGVLWPQAEPQFGLSAETAAAASDHRLIWVDISLR